MATIEEITRWLSPIVWPAEDGVTIDPRVCGGDPVLAGTRWTIATVGDYIGGYVDDSVTAADDALTQGYAAYLLHDLSRDFPDLDEDQLLTAVAYGGRHRALFDALDYQEHAEREALVENAQILLDALDRAGREAAALREMAEVVDEFAAAHYAYETMPPRPARGTFTSEVVAWEQRRLELERRCYRANRAWSALVRERAAVLAAAPAPGGGGEGA